MRVLAGKIKAGHDWEVSHGRKGPRVNSAHDVALAIIAWVTVVHVSVIFIGELVKLQEKVALLFGWQSSESTRTQFAH